MVRRLILVTLVSAGCVDTGSLPEEEGCPAGQIADGAGGCRPACTPRTCTAELCGELPDNCGGTISCNQCAAGLVCGAAGTAEANRCVPPPCEPELECGANDC